nr:MAG TPA: Paired amphipathic helix protein [Bacteriophage sp.]
MGELLRGPHSWRAEILYRHGARRPGGRGGPCAPLLRHSPRHRQDHPVPCGSQGCRGV